MLVAYLLRIDICLSGHPLTYTASTRGLAVAGRLKSVRDAHNAASGWDVKYDNGENWSQQGRCGR